VRHISTSSDGSEIMANSTQERDILLVQECLAGSEAAWDEFYRRYVGLVRSVVSRRSGSALQDVEDVTQDAFTDLIAALHTYDAAYPLSKFVAVVSERACIQHYRRRTAAKRAWPIDSTEGIESDVEPTRHLVSEGTSQEQQLSDAELAEMLKRAFRRLGDRCRQLLRLRYYEEIPYKEISLIFAATENTLTVQVKRCLDDLGICYDEILRKKLKR
jgi:RNA polymerase sigma factor (sigma-70 family)